MQMDHKFSEWKSIKKDIQVFSSSNTKLFIFPELARQTRSKSRIILLCNTPISIKVRLFLQCFTIRYRYKDL